MSLFYKSNEAKERKYVKENKIRELNDEAQQEIVDEQIDKELGLDRKATNIGLLSKRVADKLVNAKRQGEDILLNAINNGKLSELFDKIKLLPDSALTKNQQYIRDNLKVKQNKDNINELIQEAIPDGAEAIKSVIIQSLGDPENQNSLLDLVSKANKLNMKDYSNTIQPSSKKSRNRESELMAEEDINYAVKPIPSKPATPAQIEAQNKAQANLDLISLFQQDVKEGRKRQALKDLDQLSADEDLRLRKNFMKVLEEIKSDFGNKSASEQAKKEYKEGRLLVDKMMQLIENQRMHDSFMEFSNLAIKDEFRKKIARNLESLFKYKKNMKAIDDYTSKEALKEFTKNLGTKTSREKRSDSDITETTSLAGLSTRGRPADTKEKALEKMYKYKEIGDNLSMKLWERDGKKYKIRGNYRSKLTQDVENAYNNADKIAKKYGLK